MQFSLCECNQSPQHLLTRHYFFITFGIVQYSVLSGGILSQSFDYIVFLWDWVSCNRDEIY